jgi:hypothetical protein
MNLPKGYREQPANLVSPGSPPFLEKKFDNNWVGIASLLPDGDGVYLGRSTLSHKDVLAIGTWLCLHLHSQDNQITTL